MKAQEVPVETVADQASARRSFLVGASSLLFILLQSACSAVLAIGSVQLALGAGSLAAASGGLKLMGQVHGTAFRLPMMGFAVAGAVLNLYVVWRVRSLRARPSSAWRMAPVPAAKRRAETIQIAIALVTLLLVAIEWAGHIRLFGSLFA